MSEPVILAIDPGDKQSAWAVMHEGRRVGSGIENNDDTRQRIIDFDGDLLAVEMIASYGMPVGREVFETCLWIGDFRRTWLTHGGAGQPSKMMLVYRKDVKLCICGTLKANDANIRRELLDRLGPQGTKKAPGPTFGVVADQWSAIAVGVTARELFCSPTRAI